MDDTKTKELISLLQDYPVLWDKKEKDFMNRDVRRAHFQEISAELEVTEDDCKKKLKHLKDKMRDLCSKLPKTASGQPDFEAGEEIVRWQYYKSLLFMKDQFLGRPYQLPRDSLYTSSSISNERSLSPTLDTSHDRDDADDGDDGESVSSERSVTDTDPITSAVSVSMKRLHKGMGKRAPSKKFKHTGHLLQTEPERDKVCNFRHFLGDEGPKDEWRAYVDSLVHELRMITNPYLKLNVKSAVSKTVRDIIIQQLKMDEDDQHR